MRTASSLVRSAPRADSPPPGAPASGSRPLAVVTGADHATGLGAARALHTAGAEVVGLTRNPGSPACRSRVWSALHPEGGSVTDALLRLGPRLGRPAFLLPTHDLAVAEISRRRRELDELYRFALPDDDTVRLFLDKTRFHGWAQRRGLPLPESRVVCDERELRAALSSMPYPLVVKPLYRTDAWERASPVQKVLRLARAEDLDRAGFDPLAAAPALLLSEWIDGPDDAVHFCLVYCREPGRIAASFTGRKLLQYPRATGSTAICVATANGEVRELAEELFALAGFRGLGSLEVKYGPDGRPHITEPTVGRPNLQSHAAVAAGCNLQALAMADALGPGTAGRGGGEPVGGRGRGAVSGRGAGNRRGAGNGRGSRASATGRSGAATPSVGPGHRSVWWVEEGAIAKLAAEGRGESVPWRLLARELLRARRPAGAWWSWRDPRPAAALAAHGARRVIRYVRRRWGGAARGGAGEADR